MDLREPISTNVTVYYYPPPPVIDRNLSGQVELSIHKSLGHVALEIQGGDYISFWPPCKNEHCKVKTDHLHRKDIDQAMCKNFRTYQLFLQHLPQLLAAWDEFRKENHKWAMLGSGPFRLYKERNCADLTLYLLEQGGLDIRYRGRMDYFKIFFGTSFLAMGMSLQGFLYLGASKTTQKVQEARKDLDTAFERYNTVSGNAVQELSLSPTPQTTVEKNRIQYANMLLRGSFHVLSTASFQSYDVLDSSRKCLRLASSVVLLGGGVIATGSYYGAKAIRKTITPATVAMIAEEVGKVDKKSYSMLVRTATAFLGIISISFFIIRRRTNGSH